MRDVVGVKNVVTWKGSRRHVAGLMAGSFVAGTVGVGPVLAQSTPAATPVASPASGNDGRYLLAGDRTQTSLEIYSIPGLELAGAIDDIGFGTHGGVLQLPDGRVVFADTLNDAIVALAVGPDGVPVITDRVTATLGGGVAWMVASPTLSHVAIGSLQDSEESQFLNIVDLATFENTAVEIALNAPEELTAWLLNDPLNVYVAVGGQVNSYLLDDLIAGNTEPLSTVAVEFESHGGATDVVNSRLFYTTAPGTGFEVLDVTNGGAEYLTQVPWDVDGFTGGRNARPRLTADGEHIFGVLTSTLDDPTTWADAVVTNHVTDTTALTATRIEVGSGLFAGRWGITDRYALWAGYNGDGGAAYLIDADATSPTFGTVVGSIPLDLPTNAAVAGEDSSGKDGYATAITSDSAYGFVSINGDGVIKVLDLEARTEVAEIAINLPFKGFDGYIAVIEPGITPVDLWGR